MRTNEDVAKSLRWVINMLGDTTPNTFENAVKHYCNEAVERLTGKTNVQKN